MNDYDSYNERKIKYEITGAVTFNNHSPQMVGQAKSTYKNIQIVKRKQGKTPVSTMTSNQHKKPRHQSVLKINTVIYVCR